MEHIEHYYSDFDYLCVMDMDLQGTLYIDGMMHSVQLLNHPKIDVVTGNGMLYRDNEQFYYYDSFAHVDDSEPLLLNDVSTRPTCSYIHDRPVLNTNDT